MHRAGYVLAGGASSRMGTPKAFLPYRAQPLALHVAQIVLQAAGSVTLAGDPLILAPLGLPVIPDRYPGLGPLGAIHTILESTSAEWCLVTACDMPLLDPDFLRSLFDAAERESADVAFARGPSGLPEPLCAVYRTTCRPAVAEAIRLGKLKVTAALAPLRTLAVDVPHPDSIANCNTPEEWAALAND